MITQILCFAWGNPVKKSVKRKFLLVVKELSKVNIHIKRFRREHFIEIVVDWNAIKMRSSVQYHPIRYKTSLDNLLRGFSVCLLKIHKGCILDKTESSNFFFNKNLIILKNSIEKTTLGYASFEGDSFNTFFPERNPFLSLLFSFLILCSFKKWIRFIVRVA